jgi:hypothetical protein
MENTERLNMAHTPARPVKENGLTNFAAKAECFCGKDFMIVVIGAADGGATYV